MVEHTLLEGWQHNHCCSSWEAFQPEDFQPWTCVLLENEHSSSLHRALLAEYMMGKVVYEIDFEIVEILGPDGVVEKFVQPKC